MARLELTEEKYQPSVILDGLVLHKEAAHTGLASLKEGEKGYYIAFRESDLEEELLTLSRKDIDSKIFALSFPISNFPYELINLTFEIRSDEKETRSLFLLNLSKNSWKKPWSVSELKEEALSLFGVLFDVDRYAIEIGNDDYLDYDIDISLKLTDESVIIEEILLEVRPIIVNFIGLCERNLRARLSENSIVNQFNFPPEIRSSCEEYLLSFIQFLKDVGVEATADLKHEGQAGEVLFSVTPAKGQASLEKIRQALDVYLKLAGATNFEYQSGAAIQVDRLEARILSFQSQLKFAQAEMKSQQAEIEAQKTTILAERVMSGEISATNVFLRSRIDLLEKERAEKTQIEFFKGLVTYSNPEFLGFSVNLAMVLAALKNMMDEESLPPSGGPPALPPMSRGM